MVEVSKNGASGGLPGAAGEITPVPGDPQGLAELLIRTLDALSLKVVSAESCTAGLGAEILGRVPGASRVLWGSYVTYTADAKVRMVGVTEEIIRRYGLVSGECARAMAEGALERSGADAAFSVTGLAGPEGDGSGLPVGTVWIATAVRSGETCASAFWFSGSRNEVRLAAAQNALRELLNRVTRESAGFQDLSPWNVPGN